MIWMEMEQQIIESITSVNNSAIKNIKQEPIGSCFYYNGTVENNY